MISVTSLSKSFGKTPILNQLDFNIKENTITCIIGENGTGKSTLLSLLAGFTKPDKGSIFYGTTQKTPLQASLSLLPQQDNLFVDVTVKDNLSFWAAAAGSSFSAEDTQKALDRFQLRDFLKKKVSVLSGGMRRRVALCAALLSNPTYVLLDEPFNGLDLIHKREIGNYLAELPSLGKTVIYTAHNIDEIYPLANELLALHQGHIAPIPMPTSLDELHQVITTFLERGHINE